tara:strand:+ start:1046 stop:1321 length:276 start_codon:yes stop_codon:yes gene_type:complete
MTDTSKYSNISVSKKTYSDLQRLSKEILPGDTNLSISKTVTHLVNCKIKESNDLLYLQGYQTEETGFTPPKNIINRVINNSNKKDKKNGKK